MPHTPLYGIFATAPQYQPVSRSIRSCTRRSQILDLRSTMANERTYYNTHPSFSTRLMLPCSRMLVCKRPLTVAFCSTSFQNCDDNLRDTLTTSKTIALVGSCKVCGSCTVNASGTYASHVSIETRPYDQLCHGISKQGLQNSVIPVNLPGSVCPKGREGS